MGFGLSGIEGEEDNLDPHKGRLLRGVVEADNEGDERNNYQVEVGVRGEEGFVEPVVEVVRVFKHSRNRMRVRVRSERLKNTYF